MPKENSKSTTLPFGKVVNTNVFTEKQGFTNMFNNFEFNQSCMILTVIFIILFMYKDEVMKSKIVKQLLK